MLPRLNPNLFRCGDEGIRLFKCPSCSRHMAFCSVCQEVYPDLNKLNESTPIFRDNPEVPIGAFSCPACWHDFESGYWDQPDNIFSREQIIDAGLRSFLLDVPPEAVDSIPLVVFSVAPNGNTPDGGDDGQ